MESLAIRLHYYPWIAMLEWRLWGVRCRISLLFPAVVTVLLLQQPEGMAISCLLASFVHECGHLLMMLLLRVIPQSCVIGAFGMRIELGNALVGYGRNLCVSLAGPCANMLAAVGLLILASPTAATVHLALAVLNLLPFSALDGGEVLRCALCLLGFESKAEASLKFASVLMLLPLAATGFWLFVNMQNFSLLVISGYLVTIAIFSKKCEKSS